MTKNDKTNVMRLLEQAEVPYTAHLYTGTDAVSGSEVAQALGEDPEQCFKTLVTKGKSGQFYVFVIPVSTELNLKKAASVSGEKSIEMLRSKELLPLTGYVHGGCSPIGMKKLFPTFIHETAQIFDTIMFSAGKIGYQVEISPSDLIKLIPFEFADVCDD